MHFPFFPKDFRGPARTKKTLAFLVVFLAVFPKSREKKGGVGRGGGRAVFNLILT